MTDIAIAQLGGDIIPDGTPTVLQFPSVGIGSTQSLTFNIRNFGLDSLEIARITVPTGLTLDEGTTAQLTNGQFIIPRGQSRNITVSLTGVTLGTFGGNFVVQSNDPDTMFYNFPISGTVVPRGSGADGDMPLSIDELIPIVTALGEPGPGTVDNQIADGAGSSQLIGIELNDLITAGQGNDLVFGRAGNDYLFGGQGNDTILGDAGADSLSGDFGDDFLFAGPGNDLVIGRSDNDVLNGNQGDDTIGGGEGNDILFGGRDNDVLAGGLGNDILFGDLGNDTLLGGVDLDQFAIVANTGSDVIFDYEDGTDKFLLVGGLTFGTLQVIDTPTGAAIVQGETLLATVLNTPASSLETTDFLILPPV